MNLEEFARRGQAAQKAVDASIAAATNRSPEPPDDAPAGYRYEASIALEWVIVKPGSTHLAEKPARCRVHRCGALGVATLDRKAHRRPEDQDNRGRFWCYCAEHLDGRWIERGQVMQWVIVRSVADPTRGGGS